VAKVQLVLKKVIVILATTYVGQHAAILVILAPAPSDGMINQTMVILYVRLLSVRIPNVVIETLSQI